ncbi:LysR family transcriptional regulator (plasmid) [Ensifer adhaerens]|uniref:LysR family transcriptional regulator n=1 Tax=Ensifer adhaerens TaxID=106592 RepID=UPI0023A9F503|nr:LysR family transcriptional regulator [Ensifer adhaerens]WDZ79228.1 LysR family transcriptional regulator [Ensifer adhaerens]
METRFLETFLTVVEHGSLAEASRRLGVTPAAIAQRIQALEDEIGLPLLARSGRRVKPTEAGIAILEKSRRVLADVRQLKSLAHDDQAFGELRLGAISTALTGLLPNALRKVFDTTPGVDIFLLPGTSAELYNSVLEEKIDAAILVKPPFPIPKTLHWELIRSEPFVLLAPPNLTHIPPDRLLREQPFIRYDRSNWGGRLADAYLQSQRILPREWLELDSLEAISVMVEAGLGVSLMPDWRSSLFDKLRVARLPLRNAPSREIGLLRPRNVPSARLIQAVLDALRS